VPGNQLPFTSSFTAISPYLPATVGRVGVGKRAEKVVDLLAVASEHPDGITLAQAAIALFGQEGEQDRAAARRVVLRLVSAGRLRRVRAEGAARAGATPDRFMATSRRAR
jgi:hypothetical protein